MKTGRVVARNSLLLGLFAAVTAGVIAWTWSGTRDAIVAAQRASEMRQLAEIFPSPGVENALLEGRFDIAADTPLLDLRESRAAYRIKADDQIIGVILPATARDGYSGDIRLLVGVRRSGQLAGVRVASHRETPGLGDKIDVKKSDWILSFNQRSLADPVFGQWMVKKDGGVFDQFTGATVTPRSVVAAVRRALEYTASHQGELFLTESDT